MAPKLLQMGVINLGFEGAKCHFYGFTLTEEPMDQGDWYGIDSLHRYQDAEDPLGWRWFDKENQETLNHKIYWASLGTPNHAEIGWSHYWWEWTGALTRRDYPNLAVHVESNIQLEDIDRQGDPLGWSPDEPSSGQRIEYWGKHAVKEETEDKILYHYEATKQSFLIVPAEFWVGFYLEPAQAHAVTGSGWREGEWNNMVCWFRLDFHTWDNAYLDPWLDDPETNVFTSEYEGHVINQQQTNEYRGGFPIAAWIQGWEKAGATSDVEAGTQESPLWFTVKTSDSEGDKWTIDQKPELREELMAKVRFSPQFVGQHLSLFTEPEASFSYQLSEDDYSESSLTDSIQSPDSSLKKVMYFPVNIQTLGTYADGDWAKGWDVYYPSGYFRVRIIYGVYGQFTYLWTEEVTKPVEEGGLDYPEEMEREGTTVLHAEGMGSWFSGIGDFVTSPYGILYTLLFLGIIVIAAVILINPALLLGLFALKKRGGS